MSKTQELSSKIPHTLEDALIKEGLCLTSEGEAEQERFSNSTSYLLLLV
jgi:hypothetical protein